MALTVLERDALYIQPVYPFYFFSTCESSKRLRFRSKGTPRRGVFKSSFTIKLNLQIRITNLHKNNNHEKNEQQTNCHITDDDIVYDG